MSDEQRPSGRKGRKRNDLPQPEKAASDVLTGLRDDEGWTQQAVANRSAAKPVSLCRETIVKLENGGWSKALSTTRRAIAALYGISLEDLEDRIRQRQRALEDEAAGDVASPGSVGSAPTMPIRPIGRDDDLRALRDRLGVTGSRNGSSNAVTVIRGLPGVGKSTLIAALAHDPKVSGAFDGMLWTSLGPEPKVLFQVASWCAQLGDASVRDVSSLPEAAARLAALLAKQRRLLLIDDVWRAEHARPLMAGGPECSVVLTTRDKEIAYGLAHARDDVHYLTPLNAEHSLEVLRRHAPVVVDRFPDACRTLAEDLEGLPLALQVAGRLIAEEEDAGMNLEALLDDIRQGATLLRATAPPDMADLLSETTPTVAALLARSVDRLDPLTRGCYALLGSFAANLGSLATKSIFYLEEAAYVWDVTDPREVMRTLVRRGLVEPLGGDRFQIHAVLRMHARSLLTR